MIDYASAIATLRSLMTQRRHATNASLAQLKAEREALDKRKRRALDDVLCDIVRTEKAERDATAALDDLERLDAIAPELCEILDGIAALCARKRDLLARARLAEIAVDALRDPRPFGPVSSIRIGFDATDAAVHLAASHLAA